MSTTTRQRQHLHHRVIAAAVVLFSLVATACGDVAPVADMPWPTDNWRISTPEEQGVDPEPLRALDEAITSGRHGAVDRLLVVVNGSVVVDEQYDNDYVELSRGQRGPLGCGVDACESEDDVHDYNYLHPDRHPYRPDSELHALESVTKVVTAATVGAAIQRGDIQGTEAALLPYLDGYETTSLASHLRQATLEDLLTMRSGIAWDENRPFDERNTAWQMLQTDDWVSFTLDQPAAAEPGTTWTYNSGAAQLLAAVVEQATGRDLDAYASDAVFGPLGVSDHYWKQTPAGNPDAASGLYLAAEDLAKIGYLYLHDGEWDGTQVLSPGWVRDATARTVEEISPGGWGYGYHWWRPDRGDVQVWASLGFGDQYLVVLPDRSTIGVVTGWNVPDGSGHLAPETFIDALIAATESAGDDQTR